MTPTAPTAFSALRARHGPTGIAVRLMVAMALVVVSGALAAWLVAGGVGPGLFHRHMAEAAASPGTAVEHAETAFASASAVMLAVALGVSVVTSLVASVVLARRIGASLGAMSQGAAQVAAGDLAARVPQPGIGAEFDELAGAFNTMAARLDRDEALRRRLMADVAHELRTPVTTIVASLDALEDGVQELTPQVVTVLRGQAARLARLADDLAAVTRAESGELRLQVGQAQPGELLASAASAAAERYAAAGVTLTVEAPPGLPTVAVDADRFGQVLGNLLDNALRHTPAGGRVTLGAQEHGAMVRFVVEDTGEGIAAEHLPHVFERFYRVDTARDRAHGGSGIGLSIARALVRAHGGTVAAHSDGAGLGSRFVVELPGSSASLDRPQPQA
ncbi:MAG TPA: ATP-binding protein [Cellulomonas sp.]